MIESLRLFYWVVMRDRCPECKSNLVAWSDRKSICYECEKDY